MIVATLVMGHHLWNPKREPHKVVFKMSPLCLPAEVLVGEMSVVFWIDWSAKVKMVAPGLDDTSLTHWNESETVDACKCGSLLLKLT